MQAAPTPEIAGNCKSKNAVEGSAYVSPAWTEFAQKLALVLRGLVEDQFLIVTKKNSNICIQFVCEGSYGLRLETTSNYYRNNEEQLSDQDIESLSSLGWGLPTNDPDVPNVADVDGSPNHFLDAPMPLNCVALAELAVRTFIEVLRIPHPGFLQYTSSDGNGDSVPLPQLGLKLEIESDPSINLPQHLLTTVRELTGLDSLDFDEDGDIGGIQYGNIVAYISLIQNQPYIRFYSVLLRDVDQTLALFERINSLNDENGFMHLVFRDGAVIALSEILVAPYLSSHIANGLSNFCQVADDLHDILVAEFCGEDCNEPTQIKH